MRDDFTEATKNTLARRVGTRCSNPKCRKPTFGPSTDPEKAIKVGVAAHITAASPGGPRYDPSMPQAERRSSENGIWLCQNCGKLVDNDEKRYTVATLRDWKRSAEEAAIQEIECVLPNVFSRTYYTTELVDQKIKDDVELLRKSRFFPEFDRVRSSLSLARKLAEGELSGGSDIVRSRALAWCARFLSPTEELDRAEEYFDLAKTLGSCPEIEIAGAFISSQKDDKNAALTVLAGLDSPLSKSAALLVVAYHDGPKGAVDWLRKANIDAADLDPDGKNVLLIYYLQLANWDAAQECLDAVADDDLRETPILHHFVGVTNLLRTVPPEFRAIVLEQLPFSAAEFPLASDVASIEARRAARRQFVVAAQAARDLNCPGAALMSDEYALWLELRDPDESANGRQRLEARLRDPAFLRLVHLGVQFGIRLDLKAVEREIERQIALNGEITPDAAFARFALAFTQETPEDVANYIARHWDELANHPDKKSMRFIQIEMLSRAGLPARNRCGLSRSKCFQGPGFPEGQVSI